LRSFLFLGELEIYNLLTRRFLFDILREKVKIGKGVWLWIRTPAS